MKQTVLVFIFIATFGCAKCDSTIENTGNILQIAIPLSAYTTSLILKDRDGQYEFYESFALNLATTYALKYSIKKERPNGGSHSFPSGHTSAAFQGAAFIQIRYGWTYGTIAYLAAGFVGYSRVESKQHYTEDVVAGAAIGIISNLIFTRKYKNSELEVTPLVSRRSIGVLFSLNF